MERFETKRGKLLPSIVFYGKTGDSRDDWKVTWDDNTVGEFKDGVVLVSGGFAPFREMLDHIKAAQRKTIIRIYLPPVVMSLVSIDKRRRSHQPKTAILSRYIPNIEPQRSEASRLALSSRFDA